MNNCMTITLLSSASVVVTPPLAVDMGSGAYGSLAFPYGHEIEVFLDNPSESKVFGVTRDLQNLFGVNRYLFIRALFDNESAFTEFGGLNLVQGGALDYL
jgi:hypothetical protein